MNKMIVLAFCGTLISGAFVYATPVTMLATAKDSLQARTDLVNRAERSITAQYYTIDHDRISLGSLALLRHAAERGVKVKIIVDSLNNKMTKSMMAALLLNIHPHVKGNLEIKEYNQFNLFHPSSLYKRMHDKSLIIDEKLLIVGGRNIANGYFSFPNEEQQIFDGLKSSNTKSGPFRSIDPVYQDSDMLIFGGETTAKAVQYFNHLWNSKNVNEPMLYEFSAEKLAYESCMYKDMDFLCQQQREINVKKVVEAEKVFDDIMKSIRAGSSDLVTYDSGRNWESLSFDSPDVRFFFDPIDGRNADKKSVKKMDGIANQLYKAIESDAKKTVLIVTPYMVLTPEQTQLFKTLKTKGVEVSVVTNSREANDEPAAIAGYEMTRESLLKLGVHIFEYRGPDTLHAKMVLVDETKLFIGSYNWDYRSQNLNREVGVFTEVSKDLQSPFKQNLSHKLSLILSKSDVYSAEHESDLKEGLRDLLTVDLKTKNIILWKLLFPILKGQI